MRKVLVGLLTLTVIGLGSYYFLLKDGEELEVQGEKSKTETKTIAEEELLQHRAGIPVDQVWHLKFKQKLDEDTITNETISVKNEAGKKVKLTLSYDADEKTIQVENKKDYKQGHTYSLELNGVKNKKGKKIDTESFTFTIERDKNEDIVFKDSLLEIKDEISEMDATTLKFDKKNNKIKENDIIIVYPEEATNGLAIQVESVKNSFGSQIIHYTKPSFETLFEEIDLYQPTRLTEEDFKVEDAITISEKETKKKQRIDDFDQLVYRIAGKKRQKGNTIAFQLEDKEVKIGKLDAKLHGEVKLINPEVLLDLTYNEETEKMAMILDHELEANINIDMEEKDKKQTNKKLRLSEIKLASFKIPTETEGVAVTGDLFLQVGYDETGNVTSSLQVESKSQLGIVVQDSDVGIIHQGNTKAWSENEGDGKVSYHLQSNLNAALSVYNVDTFNLDPVNETKLQVEAITGNDKKVDGKYACTAEKALFSSLLFIDANISQESVLYEVVDEAIEKEADDCTHFLGYTFSQDSISLDAKGQTTIDIKGQFIDLRTMKETTEDIRDKDLIISVKDTGVLNVSKKKSNIHINIVEIPEKAETEIIVKSDQHKDKEWTIPVKVKNYEAVMKKIEEEKQKEVAGNLNGDWYMVSTHNDNTLIITEATADSFKYGLDLSYQARFDGDSGIAKISDDGKVAMTDVNKDYLNCEYTFTLDGDSIEIELGDCKTFASIPMEGVYEREKQEVEYKDLSESGYISQKADDRIKSAAGPYYEELKQRSLQFGVREDEANELNAKVIHTSVLSAGQTAIILEDDQNHAYVGLLSYEESDGDLIYFTSNPKYKNKIPDVIERWFDTFQIDKRVKMLK